MLHCAPDFVPSRRCREIARFENDPAEVFARASRPGGNLGSHHMREMFELGLKLARVVVDSDDDVTTLAPCGVKSEVMNHPSPDGVVIAIDLGHWLILSLGNSAFHNVERHDGMSISEPSRGVIRSCPLRPLVSRCSRPILAA